MSNSAELVAIIFKWKYTIPFRKMTENVGETHTHTQKKIFTLSLTLKWRNVSTRAVWQLAKCVTLRQWNISEWKVTLGRQWLPVAMTHREWCWMGGWGDARMRMRMVGCWGYGGCVCVGGGSRWKQWVIWRWSSCGEPWSTWRSGGSAGRCEALCSLSALGSASAVRPSAGPQPQRAVGTWDPSSKLGECRKNSISGV